MIGIRVLPRMCLIKSTLGHFLLLFVDNTMLHRRSRVSVGITRVEPRASYGRGNVAPVFSEVVIEP